MSTLCFYGKLDVRRLWFTAYGVWHRKEWYRMLSYGLIHGGWGHLFFNMLTLYFFGAVVEQYFRVAFGSEAGIALYVVLYVSAIAVSTVGDLIKYRNDPSYCAVGASGAVSAVLFASILLEPKMGIYIYLIPIPVPGYVFAPLYLLYCWYMNRRNQDNIGHSAHFWGAVYGLEKPLMCDPLSQSALDPRKHFVFDPYKVLAGGVIFILPYLFPLRAFVFRMLSPVSSI